MELTAMQVAVAAGEWRRGLQLGERSRVDRLGEPAYNLA